MNASKTTGFILLAIGALLVLGIGAWASSYPFAQASTRIFVIVFALLVAAPLIGLGVYTLIKGAGESKEDAQIAKQRKLLNLVQTQGQVNLSIAAIELNMPRDAVKALVYDLVGKQLFSGYIDWDAQMLYSVDAGKVKGGKCPKCGGALEVAGKGLIKCPYCGSEVFSN
jgi:ribosomal protein S27AE